MSSNDLLKASYSIPHKVWVLLKAEGGFERAVPPGAAVTFALPAEAELEVFPLCSGRLGLSAFL